jgi:hypothetical protein
MGEGEITLVDGHEIQLVELRQRGTYEGQLEGLPTIQGNARFLAWLRDEPAETRLGLRRYVVPPEQTPIEAPDYPFGEPSRLPGTLCIGRFRSRQPARDRELDYSMLEILWFQEQFAMPIDGAVLAHIREIDWAEWANDFEY